MSVFKFQALFESEKYFQVFGNVFDPLTTVSIRTRMFMDAKTIQILKRHTYLFSRTEILRIQK